MIAELKHRQPEIAHLCRRYGVRRLDVFGSAATAEAFDPARSDVDFLVEFDPHPAMGSAARFFGLLEVLQSLCQCNVDLVLKRGLRNPYFIESVNRSRQSLFTTSANSASPNGATECSRG